MRETKLQKITRLQRQKDELNEKCKEQARTIKKLSSDLKKQSIDYSIIDKYEDRIAILNFENNNLRTSIADLKYRISNLETDKKKLSNKNSSLTNDLIRRQKEILDLEKELDKPKMSQRVEDFNSGRCKDRWGEFFFDDCLYPAFNLFTGEKISLPTQVKIIGVIEATCRELYDNNLATLSQNRDLLYDGEIRQNQYEEMKHQLGMQIWEVISNNSILKSILSS